MQKNHRLTVRIPIESYALIQKYTKAGVFATYAEAVRAAVGGLPRIAAERQKSNEVTKL